MPPSRNNAADHIADLHMRERTHAISRSLGEIDLDNLSREVSEVGGWAVWWGVISAQAASDAERAADHLRIVEAQVGNELRSEHARLGEKFTVDSIADEVKLHERVRTAKAAVIDANEHAAIARAVSQSINGKQRTLENMAAHVVRELPSPHAQLRDQMRAHRDEMTPEPASRTRRQRVG